MRTFSICTPVLSLSVAFIGFVGCGPKQDNTQQPVAATTAPPGYPPPQATYSQYPQPAPTYYQQYPQPSAQQPAPQPMPQPAPPPVATQPPPGPAPTPAPPPGPAPSASAQMSIPGPMSFVACQNDVPCGTHHCNVQYGKCAFPCQTNVDCITPNSCIMGLCVPPLPGAVPTH